MSELTPLTIKDFSAHLGKAFQFRAENGECQLILRGARETKRYAGAGQARSPFSLTFAGPSGVSFQQGTYTLGHEALGEMHIFLVPVGIEEGSVQLEAVFN